MRFLLKSKERKVFWNLYNLGHSNEFAEKFSVFWGEKVAWSVVVIYFVGIVYTFLYKRECLFKFIVIPAIAFLLVTVIRKKLNRPRPFEVYNIASSVDHGQGQSFPSRHTASAFIIAFAFMYLNFYFGIVMLVLACLIAVSRIMCGLHFTEDVLSGCIISCVLGIIFFI